MNHPNTGRDAALPRLHPTSDYNPDYVPAREPVTVLLHQPVRPSGHQLVVGLLLGAMHDRGALLHYRVQLVAGSVLLAPPDWLDAASRFSVARAGLTVPATVAPRLPAPRLVAASDLAPAAVPVAAEPSPAGSHGPAVPRRSLLAVAASTAAAVAGVPAAAMAVLDGPADLEPDGELLTLCGDQVLDYAAVQDPAGPERVPGTPQQTDYEARLGGVADAAFARMDRIAAMPARTVGGVRAKALAALAWGGTELFHERSEYGHERLVGSLLRDLAGGVA